MSFILLAGKFTAEYQIHDVIKFLMKLQKHGGM